MELELQGINNFREILLLMLNQNDHLEWLLASYVILLVYQNDHRLIILVNIH